MAKHYPALEGWKQETGQKAEAGAEGEDIGGPAGESSRQDLKLQEGKVEATEKGKS